MRLPDRGQLPGERAAAGAAADDHDVVVLSCHEVLQNRCQSPRDCREIGDASAIERWAAETMNPRCENACGKFPIMRFSFGSYSSENRPTSLLQRAQAFEHLARLVGPTDEREVVDQPERRHQERAFARREAVDGVAVLGDVSQHETVDQELALDRFDRADDPRIGRRQEPDPGQHEQARVELVGAVVLHEAVLLGVEALVAHLLVHLVAELRPLVDREVVPVAVLRDTDRPVERDPRHDFGVREVMPRPADLPDPVVGLIPDLLEVLEHRRQQLARPRDGGPGGHRGPGRVGPAPRSSLRPTPRRTRRAGTASLASLPIRTGFDPS